MTTSKEGHLLPGRNGSLTEDQENHLKEMWLQLLVFMGYVPKDLSTVQTLSSMMSTETSMHKKKRGGFFHRKQRSIGVSSPEAQAETLRHSVRGLNGSEFEEAFRRMIRIDHPDNLVLRFLRARKWDVAKGLGMFGDTIAWRVEQNIEEMVQKGELLGTDEGDEGLILQLTDGKAQIHGFDKQARPIVHIGAHLHKPKAQGEESIQRYTITTIENARLCLEDPVDTAAVIFDLGKFTLANMDYGAVKFMLKCFESHYPESLGFVLIHRAPLLFSGIWSAIKGWIDPDVAAKITFTRNYKDLLKHVDANQIPKELGGEREWEYHYDAPSQQENKCLKDTLAGNSDTKESLWNERVSLFEKYYEATASWCKSKGEESKNWQKKKNELALKIKQNYWKLDPYIRATSILDRDGTLNDFHGDELARPDHCPIGNAVHVKDENQTVQHNAINGTNGVPNGSSKDNANGTSHAKAGAPHKEEPVAAAVPRKLTRPTEPPPPPPQSKSAPAPSPTKPRSRIIKADNGGEFAELVREFGEGLAIIDEDGEEDVFFDTPKVIYLVGNKQY